MRFRFKGQWGLSGADKSYFLGNGKVRRGWGLEFQFVKTTKPSVSKIRESVNYLFTHKDLINFNETRCFVIVDLKIKLKTVKWGPVKP